MSASPSRCTWLRVHDGSIPSAAARSSLIACRERTMPPSSVRNRAEPRALSIRPRKRWSSMALATRSSDVLSTAPCSLARPSVREMAASTAAALSVSLITSKWAGMRASKGAVCRTRVQNAWMVCNFRPPGVSSASANKRLARVRSAADGACPSTSVSPASSEASSSGTQAARMPNNRLAMFAAAAVV